MTEIDERQQKRAANIVWNCAGRYDFRPDFRAYDVKGRADLYWNCIFGAAPEALRLRGVRADIRRASAI